MFTRPEIILYDFILKLIRNEFHHHNTDGNIKEKLSNEIQILFWLFDSIIEGVNASYS